MAQDFSAVKARMLHASNLKNDTALARELDITPQAISNYKARGKMPTDLVVKFAGIYGLSIDWLLNATGEPFKNIEGVKAGARIFLSKDNG